MPILNTSYVTNVDLLVSIGPAYSLAFEQAEPGPPALLAPLAYNQTYNPGMEAQTNSIQGVVGGVPVMGAGGMWTVWAGEEFDTSWFNNDAPVIINDWGDGSDFDATGSHKHTYAMPGGFWVQAKADASYGALATRFVRVLNPNYVPGVTNVLDMPYPLMLDGAIQGNVQADFTMRFKAKIGDRPIAASMFSDLPEGTCIQIVAQEYRYGDKYSHPRVVFCGLLSDGEVENFPTGNIWHFAATGLASWLVDESMSTMQFMDGGAAVMGAAFKMAKYFSDSTGVDSPPPPENPFLVGGDNVHHGQLKPTLTALHLLFHVRVTAEGMPLMETTGALYSAGQDYGSIGQVFGILVDSGFTEVSENYTPAMPEYAVTANDSVWTAIQQLLDNDGFRCYSNEQLNIRIEARPAFRENQPDAILTIDTADPNGLRIGKGWRWSRGKKVRVKQVIAKRNGLAAPTDAAPYTAPTGYTHMDYSALKNVTTPEWPGTGQSGATKLSSIWSDTKTNSNVGMDTRVLDPVYKASDPTESVGRWPATPNASGKEHTVTDCYANNLTDFAHKLYNEIRCHYGLTLPLGTFLEARLGSNISFSHIAPGISWSGKLFDVVATDSTPIPHEKRWRTVVTLKEINPDA